MPDHGGKRANWIRRSLAGVALTAALASVSITAVAAPPTDGVLKLASGQRGSWDAGICGMGMRAGIFAKHHLTLDIFYTSGSRESLQAVLDGKADIGIAVGTLAAMAAFAKGAPIRIIGSEINGAGDYWYVPAGSPIHSMRDTDGKTIAYSSKGASTESILRAFISEYGLDAAPLATGGPAATFAMTMAGRVDVGWATPPFGLAALEQGKIRIIGRGNDLNAIRRQTNRVNIATLAALRDHAAAIAGFAQAYRETVDYMYSDPAALDRYAAFAGVSTAVARSVRDNFLQKDMLLPDRIIGLDGLMAEAVTLGYLQAPLTPEQLATLIQIPAPPP